MSSQTTWKDPSARLRLAADMNRFAFRLFNSLCNARSGNVFLSPSSISTTLAMTFAGAEGATRDEMATALGYSIANEKLHEAIRELREITRTGGVEFRSANRLWGQAGYPFRKDFTTLMRDFYGSELALVDFESRSDEARSSINRWIEEQTQGKIKELIPSGVLQPLTRLILTNAVYFLGTWESPFDAELTRCEDFVNTSGKSTAVPMMRQVESYRYSESDSLQLLELPYQRHRTEIDSTQDTDPHVAEMRIVESSGSDFVMMIVLPRANGSVQEIARLFESEGLSGLPPSQCAQVRVRIPRFKIESGLSLMESLKALGIERAFSADDAEFGRMSDDPEGLFIAEVIHRAYVDVNEMGTEAAAATAAVMFGSGGPLPPPKDFVADHSFVFLIKDRITSLVHFIGRLEEPQTE